MNNGLSANMNAIIEDEITNLHWGKVVYGYIPPFVDYSHKLIINGDDFGMDNSINTAVIKSFENSLISSTSLITNMPGFKHAEQLIHTHKLLHGNVGIHINITEGYPLTEEIKKCKRFCDEEGEFIHKRKQSIFLLTSDERRAVSKEVRAQIKKIFHSNIKPSHLDSHHHIHTEWGISKIVIQLAKEFGIRKIRLCRNMGKDTNTFKSLYRSAFNFYLKNKIGVASSHFFGEINDLVKMEKQIPQGKVIEIMTHPHFDDHGNIVDRDKKDLHTKLSPFLHVPNKISYKDI